MIRFLKFFRDQNHVKTSRIYIPNISGTNAAPVFNDDFRGFKFFKLQEL